MQFVFSIGLMLLPILLVALAVAECVLLLSVWTVCKFLERRYGFSPGNPPWREDRPSEVIQLVNPLPPETSAADQAAHSLAAMSGRAPARLSKPPP